MAMREMGSGSPGFRVIVADGVSDSVTIDFTKDLDSQLNSNQLNQVVGNVNSDNGFLPVTITRQGRRVTIKFASAPQASVVRDDGGVDHPLNVTVFFVFDS